MSLEHILAKPDALTCLLFVSKGTPAVALHDLRQARDRRNPRGVLNDLRTNTQGNALAIAAASMIPIVAAIGAGVDMSRVYATRTRMQQACDAGVLAVRRSISGSTIDTASNTLGQQFYNVNFPPATFGSTTTVAFTAAIVPSTNAVSGTSTVTLPYTMMPVVGLNNQQITVNCQASQDYVNTDIVLVLDNTGSMKCAPSANSGQNCSSEVSGSKMQGQRDAVMALYDALATAQSQLEAKGLRLRYGIVPYSGTVNVGKLLYGTNNNLNAVQTTSNYQQNVSVCTLRILGICFSSTSSISSNPVSHNQAFMTTWASPTVPTKGCIEERATVNTINANTTTIPAAAWDLDLDMLPTTANPNTQWAPYDEVAEEADSGSACPAPAVALKAFDRASLLLYVNTLIGAGNTYSDIGMIWGGRFISDAGVFAASPTSFAKFPVKKFVILMTDGYITTGADYYAAWGVESYDHRVSANPYPGDTQDTVNHKQRFGLACGAVKSKGASIWVIGFGSGVAGATDPTLLNCASSSDQYAVIADSPTLIAKFADIGRQIGSLRVIE